VYNGIQNKGSHIGMKGMVYMFKNVSKVDVFYISAFSLTLALLYFSMMASA